MLPSLTCFIVLACRGFWNTRTDRKSRLLRPSLARPAPWLILVFLDPCRKRTLFPVGNVDNRICTVLLANVLAQVDVAVYQDKNMFTLKLPPHAQSVILHVTSPPSPFIFRACMILTMNARLCQKTHPLGGMGSSLNASNDICRELLTLARTCGSELVMGAVCTAVVG